MSTVKNLHRNSFMGQQKGPKPEEKASEERTRLHTREIVHWLRSRFTQASPNPHYLYYPEELKKEREVDKIFKQFDEDNSGKLGLGEFYNMLKEAHLDIAYEDVKEFYKLVDVDNDVALDFLEFKNCTLSEEANFHFSNMMKKVKKRDRVESLKYHKGSEKDEKQQELKNQNSLANLDFEENITTNNDSKRKQYLPQTFGNLLNYITYGNKRRELIEFLSDDSIKYGQRFEKFHELFNLQMDKDIYLAKYNERFKNFIGRDVTRNFSKGFSTKTMLESRMDFPKDIPDSVINGPMLHIHVNSKDNLINELEGISKQAKKEAIKEFDDNLKMPRKGSSRLHTASTNFTSPTFSSHLNKRPITKSTSSKNPLDAIFTQNSLTPTVKETKFQSIASPREFTSYSNAHENSDTFITNKFDNFKTLKKYAVDVDKIPSLLKDQRSHSLTPNNQMFKSAIHNKTPTSKFFQSQLPISRDGLVSNMSVRRKIKTIDKSFNLNIDLKPYELNLKNDTPTPTNDIDCSSSDREESMRYTPADILNNVRPRPNVKQVKTIQLIKTSKMPSLYSNDIPISPISTRASPLIQDVQTPSQKVLSQQSDRKPYYSSRDSKTKIPALLSDQRSTPVSKFNALSATSVRTIPDKMPTDLQIKTEPDEVQNNITIKLSKPTVLTETDVPLIPKTAKSRCKRSINCQSFVGRKSSVKGTMIEAFNVKPLKTNEIKVIKVNKCEKHNH